jgi:hypothetical protein
MVGWGCCLPLCMSFVVLAESMLFVELAKAEDDWLWRSSRTSNKLEHELCCFGKPVVERAKGRIENTGYEVMAKALCGSLLWMMIAA